LKTSDTLFAARLHVEKGTLLSDEVVKHICAEFVLLASRDESDRRGLDMVEDDADYERVQRALGRHALGDGVWVGK